MFRAELDFDNYRFEICNNNQKKESILLKNCEVRSLTEFAYEKLVIYVFAIDLLIIHKWEQVHIIAGDSPGNVDMYWLEPLPGFDEQNFPFLISSGAESLNLINVKEYEHEPLIKAAVWTNGQ